MTNPNDNIDKVLCKSTKIIDFYESLTVILGKHDEEPQKRLLEAAASYTRQLKNQTWKLNNFPFLALQPAPLEGSSSLIFQGTEGGSI